MFYSSKTFASEQSHIDDIEKASRAITQTIHGHDQLSFDDKIKLSTIVENNFQNTEKAATSSQVTTNLTDLFTAINLKNNVITEIKKNAFRNDPQQAFNQKMDEHFKKARKAQISLSIKNPMPVKIDKNWHDIQKSNPKLVQAADEFIAQKPLLHRLWYPNNAYKRTQCYCNELHDKLAMALSHDLATINPHYSRYQELLEQGQIDLLLEEAIINAKNKKEEDALLEILADTSGTLTEEILNETISKLLLGEKIIEKLEQGKLTPDQLNLFLSHAPDRNIDPKDIENYKSCLRSHPPLRTRNYQTWHEVATTLDNKEVLTLLQDENLK